MKYAWLPVFLCGALASSCSDTSIPNYTVVAEMDNQQIARFGTSKHNLVFTDPSVITLAKGTKLAASHNREWLVYIGDGSGPDACAGVCRMKVDGSEVKMLKAVDTPQSKPTFVAIANDGETVAYSMSIHGDASVTSTLEVLTAEGETVQLTTTTGSSEQYEPNFSASGKYVVTVDAATTDIYEIATKEKKGSIVKDQWFRPHPTKDEIIYVTRESKVVSFDIATQKETELATIPSGEVSKKYAILGASPLELSHDGNTLAVAYTGGNPVDVLNQDSGVPPTDTIGRLRLGTGSDSLDHWIEPQQIVPGTDHADFTGDNTHLVFGVIAGPEPRAHIGPISDGSAGPFIRHRRIAAIFAVK